MEAHMRKFIITCLVVPFIVIKVAFIFRDDSHIKKTYHTNREAEPTYRVSAHVYPDFKIKVSAALSEVNKDGTIDPMFIIKSPSI